MINEKEIDDFCKRFNIIKYGINNDGSIDVYEDVKLSNPLISNCIGNNIHKLTEIPIKFNKVNGDFYCNNNQISSLKNSPNELDGDFYCAHNNLTTLKGGPIKFKGIYYSRNNPLISLDGYVGDYENLVCDDKDRLVAEHKRQIRKDKLSKIKNLLQ